MFRLNRFLRSLHPSTLFRPLVRRLKQFVRALHVGMFEELLREIGRRRLPGLASEMAYNAMLALFPGILALLTAFGNSAYSEPLLRTIAENISTVAPEAALEIIGRFVAQIELPQGQRLLSVSFLVALWIASSAISAAMNAMDQIHRVPPEARRPFWKAKLISLGLTVGTIVLLVTSSFLIFISDLLIRLVLERATVLADLFADRLLSFWRLLSWPSALVMMAAAFGTIYRYGPSRWVPGTPIAPGAIAAALLWAGTSALFRIYVSHFAQYNRIYGAVGAAIVLLLWLNLSALAVLIGAQFNVTLGDELRRDREGPGDRAQPPRSDPRSTPRFRSHRLQQAIRDRLERTRGDRDR